jgi:hypothetical protein
MKHKKCSIDISVRKIPTQALGGAILRALKKDAQNGAPGYNLDFYDAR